MNKFSITAKKIREVFPNLKLPPKEDVIIKTADTSDIDKFTETGEWSKEILKENWFEPNHHILVSYNKNTPIGYVVLQFDKRKNLLELYRIFTIPNCRRKFDVGTAQMIAFLCKAKKMGAENISVFNPKNLKKIFSRIGLPEDMGQAHLLRDVEKHLNGVDLSKC